MEENELRKCFEERNLRGTNGELRVNENIWKLFKRLYYAKDKFESCYLIAEEISALTSAIMSLDNHICMLMGKYNKMNLIHNIPSMKGGDKNGQ